MQEEGAIEEVAAMLVMLLGRRALLSLFGAVLGWLFRSNKLHMRLTLKIVRNLKNGVKAASRGRAHTGINL
jgi:hypothetical protein